MLIAALWGLVQGLTEFLPISSSGHTVLVPALLGIPPPDLATSAVLHLGTLVAVLAYYRADLARMAGFRHDPQARNLIVLLAVGTVPAALAGLLAEGPLSAMFVTPRGVAVALIGTGAILLGASLLPAGLRRLSDLGIPDAALIGLAQALALVPGISRSGATIAAGLARGMEGVEAARFAFLLAIPAIAGAGLLQLLEMGGREGVDPALGLGVLVAAVSGYAAIAVLIRAITRFGLLPFSAYCLLAGSGALLALP